MTAVHDPKRFHEDCMKPFCVIMLPEKPMEGHWRIHSNQVAWVIHSCNCMASRRWNVSVS